MFHGYNLQATKWAYVKKERRQQQQKKKKKEKAALVYSTK